jgi:predicted AlkP superfamily pyrophosphatase or phosphodiesterase
MAHSTAVILAVALTDELIGEWSPRLRAFREGGTLRRLQPVLPAVTCSVQSSMLTGLPPREHGIVGNGWYDRPSAEIRFWKQSNHLVTGEKAWETARRRDPSITCATMFWWYNMYSSADYSVTPRPIYKADGRKIPDCYSSPSDLRDELQNRLGRFPLFNFWGPAASIASSRWIADASSYVHERHDPTLTLIYLPHLDYALQKYGPADDRSRSAVTELDGIIGDLIDHFDQRDTRVIICSEYGIEPVDQAVHINRALREDGALTVRVEDGHELLDAGASDAFAIADHQIAHVYVRDPASVGHFRELCASVAGVEAVLDRDDQATVGLNHDRAGDLVLIANPNCWFSYYYWLDDARAPDFARSVDIHRKPGYDPVELFLDPRLTLPRLQIGSKLIRRKIGFRTLLDVIPLDTSLVRGSHGRIDQPPEAQPIVLTRSQSGSSGEEIPCTAMRDVILDHLFSARPG